MERSTEKILIVKNPDKYTRTIKKVKKGSEFHKKTYQKSLFKAGKSSMN